MAWEWRENNREEVLASLQKGEYEAILTSRDGALDALAQLACELGVFEAVELIEVERAGVPDELALCTLAVLPFVEAMSLSAAANIPPGRVTRSGAIAGRLKIAVFENSKKAGIWKKHCGLLRIPSSPLPA